jgi:hypothetical protein
MAWPPKPVPDMGFVRVAGVAIAACAVVLLLQGCSLMRQGAPSERQFRKHQASHPYVADPARAQAIVSGAKRIEICSRRTDVRKLIGEPDFGVLTYDSNGNHNAVKWTYLLREMPGPGGHRQAVDVTMNAARYVISICNAGESDIRFTGVNDGPGCEPT